MTFIFLLPSLYTGNGNTQMTIKNYDSDTFTYIIRLSEYYKLISRCMCVGGEA